MTLYPRRDVEIKDLMDGDWVHSLRDERAAPMVRLRDGRHAFREEPVQLNDNRFILPGEPRTSKHTKSNLVKQTRLSAHGRVTAPEDNIRESGSSDAWTSQVCDELRKLHVKSKQPRDVLTAGLRSALHDAIEDRPWAALLDVQDFNPALQLPLELLHVVLLGFAKYLMRATIAELEPSDKIQLAAWLGDANVEGLGLDSKVRGGYMMRHSLSLNGKDFRAMLQIIPSALPKFLESGEHSRTLRNLTEAWIAAARLAAALYVSSIRRSKQNEYKASGASNYYSSLVDAPTY
ncbi:hypothetical protein CF335_g4705 [Tilletia laevis]|nr:hypothetical protein CF335_g4705 [Tilletia laevis]